MKRAVSAKKYEGTLEPEVLMFHRAYVQGAWGYTRQCLKGKQYFLAHPGTPSLGMNPRIDLGLCPGLAV